MIMLVLFSSHPVVRVLYSLGQLSLQVFSQTSRAAELLHDLAGVLQLVRRQERLQDRQVALQRLEERRHRLRRYRGVGLSPRGLTDGQREELSFSHFKVTSPIC